MPLPKPVSLTHALLVACACMLAPAGLVQRVDAEEVVEQLELLRRQALIEEAGELIRKGDELLAAGRHDHALEAFSGVREMLPDAPATRATRQAASRGFVDASIGHARVQAESGDLAGARETIARVLGEDVAPGHPEALKLQARINDPVRYNPAVSPEHAADVDEVLALLHKAEGAVDLGRLDLARTCYENVLKIDPANKAARRGMVRVIEEMGEAHAAAYDHLRAEMLSEVEAGWELKPEKIDMPDAGPDAGSEEGRSGYISVDDKLDRIMVPRIAMEQVTMQEAVDFLRAVSVREDKISTDDDTRGVNFTFNLGPDEIAREFLNKRVDLQLRNVPIKQVLHYITRQTDTSYVVDDYAVVIRPHGAVADELIVRTYQVPPDFLSSLSRNAAGESNDNPFGDSSNQGGLLTARLSVQEVLSSKGVRFPDGAVASYSPGAGLLRVVNTASNQDLIAQIIDITRQTEPIAVSVQVTMIQTQQNNLKELGFDWLISPLSTGANATFAGGSVGNGSPRVAGDFSSAFPNLPGAAADTVNTGILTSGLRSGSFVTGVNSIDNILANPNRQTQTTRVAPGILSLTGVFTDGDVQLIMRGLDQKEGVDTLVNPSLVTRSGQSAKVSLIREFIYPTEYDPPEVSNSGGGLLGSVPVVPANPTAFETREVGVTLEVLPVADEQKTYIDLTLNPSVIEFDGFVNYGSPIFDQVSSLFGSQPTVVSENRILMPVFNTQRTTTQLTIADGATIAFGGLMSQSIQSAEDKVPVLGDVPMLGRLFRSTTQAPMSKAVVFLVRVELMDPGGRRYRQPSDL